MNNDTARHEMKTMFANIVAMQAFLVTQERYRIAHGEADLKTVAITMQGLIDIVDEINQYIPAGEA